MEHKVLNQKGFTLVEMIVVISMVVVLSSVLVLNFRGEVQDRRKLKRQQIITLSDIRKVQSLAIASVDSEDICGYGLHFIDSVTYAIYQGSDEGGISCPDTNHNYDPTEDGPFFEVIKVKEQNVELTSGSDLNNDGVVNILDLSLVGSCVGQDPSNPTNPDCENADIDGDGDIDIDDAIIVSNSFGLSGFPDIFFEAPDPKVYLDNQTFPSSVTPILRTYLKFCIPNDICESISIWNSGKIDAN